ncbi:dynamin-1-like protein [Thrips palmi]|uniref:Dynamin-1-like protein n=1 Tax=Thrips palmi TaxID=161013 RepID=A0A6P8Y4X1_THRPL|nr:dynamin-1-like protein [Thrips palmi]
MPGARGQEKAASHGKARSAASPASAGRAGRRQEGRSQEGRSTTTTSDMAMKNLLTKLNKVQDLFSAISYEKIELPKIVVVGSQSAGKSSVLESLVKKSFLPRGAGLVTRCPLVLHLHHCPIGDSRRKNIDLEEWGTFLHAEDCIFNMEDICTEIEARTSVIAGSNRGIVPSEITLNVFSPHVVDLTLVDLPGITKNPVGDQPKDIEAQIEHLINHYISNPLTIILAVVTANVDMANSESLKLAHMVDPEGERTLAVVTKIDLMDEGTDARDILNGKIIPVKLGIVGVVNRSQKDLDEKKTVEDTFVKEKKFFEEKYKEIASRTGSPYLAKKLSSLLSAHIDKCLPDVEDKIRIEIIRCSKIIDECGDLVTDKPATLMSFINKFSQNFSSLCEKGSQNLESLKLTGGAKLCDILHSGLEKVFANCEPCKSYTIDQVVIALRQSNGLKPPFFVSELAFEMLIKPLIKDMETPALECVEAVKKELGNMCHLSVPEQLKFRFPQLKQALVKVLLEIVEKRGQKAVQMIRDLVAIEIGHITYYRIDVLKEEFKNIMTAAEPANKCNAPSLPFQAGNLRKQLENELNQGDEIQLAEISSQLNLLVLSEKDRRHIIILGKMLDHYYKIVAETMQDCTAKAVVTFLVNEVRGSLNTELCLALMQGDLLDHLFSERDDVTEKRDSTLQKLDVLKKSLEVIAGIVYT